MPADPLAPAGMTITDVEADHFRRAVDQLVPRVRTFAFWVAYAEVAADLLHVDPARALAEAAALQPAGRQGQLDREATTRELAALLCEMDLGEHKRIGIELPFTGPDVLGWLRTALPTVSWHDATGIFAELRMLKTPAELASLQIATELAEVGIKGTLASLCEGITARELVHAFQRAVLADERVDRLGLDIGVQRLSLRSGPNVLSAEAYGPHPLTAGDLLFLDCGVEVNGYRSDMGRTAAFMVASPAAQHMYECLLAGQVAVRRALQPGVAMSELFDIGMHAVHAAGLPDYVRGNIGHGIGLDPQPELPIISREDQHVLAPNMVISVEFPFYVHGLGAFQIEDTYHITPSGAEQWTHLPQELMLV